MTVYQQRKPRQRRPVLRKTTHPSCCCSRTSSIFDRLHHARRHRCTTAANAQSSHRTLHPHTFRAFPYHPALASVIDRYARALHDNTRDMIAIQPNRSSTAST